MKGLIIFELNKALRQCEFLDEHHNIRSLRFIEGGTEHLININE